ncbi:MAG: ATP synthase F1 subunit delta [Gemmatimonadales bacterium]|nr:MAG: ATP synthase F1 subunit delta [Gemmatimonadales bacterium]
MRGDSIARNYAEALFDLAEREGRLEEYGGALDTVEELLDEVPDLALFLDTPRIQVEKKRTVLEETLGGRVPAHVMNFLLLVLDRHRHRLLGSMAREYRALLDLKLGRTHVEVAVARSLDEGEAEHIGSELSRILGVEAIPHVRVRPELIGGITFKSGDTIFDGSVRRRLQRMRHELLTTDVSTDQG